MTVAEKRKQLGYSQDDMAAKLGVKQSYYSRMERGQANPTLDKLRRWAESLDMQLPELVAQLPDATVRSGDRTTPRYLFFPRLSPSMVGS